MQLNEGIGSYTADLVWSGAAGAPAAPRSRSTVDNVAHRHLRRRSSSPRPRSSTCAATRPAVDIHANWRAGAMRERLDRANGHHDNQVIWASGAAASRRAPRCRASRSSRWTPGSRPSRPTTATRTRAEKIVDNRPAPARHVHQHQRRDRRGGAADVGLGTPACPVAVPGARRDRSRAARSPRTSSSASSSLSTWAIRCMRG